MSVAPGTKDGAARYYDEQLHHRTQPMAEALRFPHRKPSLWAGVVKVAQTINDTISSFWLGAFIFIAGSGIVGAGTLLISDSIAIGRQGEQIDLMQRDIQDIKDTLKNGQQHQSTTTAAGALPNG